MKFQSVRIALISGFVLMSPVLSFAGGQPKVRMNTAEELQDRTGITRAVQQGKGGGLSLSDATIRADAYRVQTGEEAGVVRQEPSKAPRPNYSDSAFTK